MDIYRRSRNIENRNWQVGLRAFVLLMIVLSDGPRCSEPYQSYAEPYLTTLLPVPKHPTRKLVSSPPNFRPVRLAFSH